MTDQTIPLPDLPPAASHPDFRRFYDYWRAAAPAGCLPGRQHVDPLVDLPQLIPSIVLYDAVPGGEGLRFRIRVAGETLVEIMGTAPTGRFIDEFVVADRRAQLNEAFSQVVRARAAHYWENQIWTAGRQYIRMQRLALPLARDGRIVDMIFACYVRVDIPLEKPEEQ
ncbi:MAG: PAS domain-containing protein [Proteobacteria bacterium]|nr:PAS domain-containing protein [Pseudomonadota bacterium]